MKRCRRCGAANGDGDKFCGNCGNRLGSSDSNLLFRFIDAGIFPKLIVVAVVLFAVLLLSAWAAHVFLGMPLEEYTDGEETSYLSEFESLDIDGDGGLSLYEIQGTAPDVSDDNLWNIFDSADKNGDGLLKGAEFDGYLYQLEKHYEKMEKEKRSQKENAKQQKTGSSSSVSSFPSVKYGNCPSCGNDAEEYMYEYYDEFGYPYYQCTVCGYWTYDEGEFYEE